MKLLRGGHHLFCFACAQLNRICRRKTTDESSSEALPFSVCRVALPPFCLFVCVCECASVSIHPISEPTGLLRSAVVAQLEKQPANYGPFFLPPIPSRFHLFCFPLTLAVLDKSGSRNTQLNKRKSHMGTHTQTEKHCLSCTYWNRHTMA